MPTNPTSTGPFVWSGLQPPSNINRDQYLERPAVEEIKDNADFLDDNTEACFNEKINLYSDRDATRRDTRYTEEFATKRDTVDTTLHNTNRDSRLHAIWSTAYTGRNTTRYGEQHSTAYYDECDARWVWWGCPTREVNYYSGDNSPYNATVGGCSGYHATYHSGVDGTDHTDRNTTKFNTLHNDYNSTVQAAQHNTFCSVLA